MPTFKGNMVARKIVAILIFSMLIMDYSGKVMSIICYENISKNDKQVPVNCRNCSLCAMEMDIEDLPSRRLTSKPIDNNIEDLKPYETFFGMGGNHYKVLSVCVLEKYSLFLGEESTYFLRCMCNRNYCNRGNGFANYFTRIVAQDMGFEHLFDALKKKK